jgi:tryptophan synthase alpha chain
VAPTTTSERLQIIARQARGYLYYVSFKGITGASSLDEAGLAGPVQEIRAHSDLPVAVGFGIKSAANAAAVAALADAVVIGSALIEQVQGARSSDEACERVMDFLAPIRHAMDNIN